MRAAIVWFGDPSTRGIVTVEQSRLKDIGAALNAVGIEVEACIYADVVKDDVLAQLTKVDAALVWVNPTEKDFTRLHLDAVLRDVANQGVLVSAHPDVIRKMGTKEVLYDTRGMSWGTDTRLYRTFDDFTQRFPESVATGPRVLKQYRGNGGFGVFKTELASGDTVRVFPAKRGSTEYVESRERFYASMQPYFSGEGRLIDQPFQQRLSDGTVRCYLSGDKVVGFGEQLLNALYVPDANDTRESGRFYFPPTREDFQTLKHQLEDIWLPEMMTLLNVARDELPVIWDTDFLYGPKDNAGQDTYVLCEINISAVFPIPDSSLAPLAAETLRRLSRR